MINFKASWSGKRGKRYVGWLENMSEVDVCKTGLSASDLEKFKKAIKNEYVFEFFVDDLPVVDAVGILVDGFRYFLKTHINFQVSVDIDYNVIQLLGRFRKILDVGVRRWSKLGLLLPQKTTRISRGKNTEKSSSHTVSSFSSMTRFLTKTATPSNHTPSNSSN